MEIEIIPSPIPVVIIACLVWLLMVILNKIYYKPIGEKLDEREAKIEKENKEIQFKTAEIEKETKHVESVLMKAKKESGRIKEELIKKGEQLRSQIVNDAREETRQYFDTKMRELDGEIAGAEKKLEKEISLFSEKMKEIFID